jgi:uncharacterized protein
VQHFALTAAIFEGSLVLAALALGWLLGTKPLQTLHWELRGVAWGLAGTAAPLMLFWLCLKCPWRPLRQIARIMNETIVPLFRGCRLVELAIIAALAGVGEEILFRGVIQAAVMQRIGGPAGVWPGLAVAAVLFGLLHPITPTYAILAGLIGLYFGWLWLASDNLLAPIAAHAVYDFVALVYLTRKRGGCIGYSG